MSRDGGRTEVEGRVGVVRNGQGYFEWTEVVGNRRGEDRTDFKE